MNTMDQISVRPFCPPQHSASAGRDVVIFNKATAARSWILRSLVRKRERQREKTAMNDYHVLKMKSEA